jgi:hypothetical protein
MGANTPSGDGDKQNFFKPAVGFAFGENEDGKN